MPVGLTVRAYHHRSREGHRLAGYSPMRLLGLVVVHSNCGWFGLNEITRADIRESLCRSHSSSIVINRSLSILLLVNTTYVRAEAVAVNVLSAKISRSATHASIRREEERLRIAWTAYHHVYFQCQELKVGLSSRERVRIRTSPRNTGREKKQRTSFEPNTVSLLDGS
jgi:hypothetical protein